jgi:hypothetical protein
MAFCYNSGESRTAGSLLLTVVTEKTEAYLQQFFCTGVVGRDRLVTSILWSKT